MAHRSATGSYSFFMELYENVNDHSLDAIISWTNNSNNSFIVWDVPRFCTRILPKSVEFGKNFSEFVSELRHHGFLRIDPLETLMGLGFLTLVGVTEKDSTRDATSKFENPILNKLDAHVSGLLDLVSSEEDFAGKPGKSASSPAAFQDLGEAVATIAKASQSSSVAVALSSHDNESKLSSVSALELVLGLFEDCRYKSESKKPSLSSVDIVGFGTGPELENKLKYAEDVSYGVIFGRELINSPANVLTPAVISDEASKVASTFSDVFSANILNEEQCRELKMGSYLAVASASAKANPPFFIHLVYRPPSGSVRTKHVLIGKGLTFDSDGYNIKAGPGSSINLMKFDMGGSAAILCAAKAIGEIKHPGVEVHFIVAVCENMISGTGMRHGDVK
uniref:HSF-type DNA-binding domain-containing protein n=1 Tax=Brassica oleracea var. oleracea TaxID=109376 RepID=A0A0D3C0V1_BRAOL